MSTSSSEPTTRYDEFLRRAYQLSSSVEAERLYNEWAENYDEDLTSSSYASPRRAVDTLLQHLSILPHQKLRILDAGCGTGLVGDYLFSKEKMKDTITLDGVDLSPRMLEVAKTKSTYAKLIVANLNDRLDITDAVYEAVICVGTLTEGHVGPNVLTEFLRLLKDDGMLVATIHDKVFIDAGFQEAIAALETKGQAKIVSQSPFGIMEKSNKGGTMLVLQKSLGIS